MTIIDWMNQMLVHKKPWDSFSESDQKTFNAFIINRWLSMDMDFINVVNLFQRFSIGLLQPREVYKWYCDVLPRGKRFNKYIKGKKDKKYDKELIEIISEHFRESKSHVIDYLTLFFRNKSCKLELEEILKKYGLEEKKIKRLCK